MLFPKKLRVINFILFILNIGSHNVLTVLSVLFINTRFSSEINLWTIVCMILLPLDVMLTVVLQIICKWTLISILFCYIWVQAILDSNFIRSRNWRWGSWLISFRAVEMIVYISSHRSIFVRNVFKCISSCIFFARYTLNFVCRYWCRFSQLSWVISGVLWNFIFAYAASHFLFIFGLYIWGCR